MLTLATAVLATALSAVPSPAAHALATGDLRSAATLPANDNQEATYLQARVALARFDFNQAELLKRKLHPHTREAVEVEWYLAHGARDPSRIARAAAELCTLGDPTGRACADAELYGGNLNSKQHVILADGRTKLPLVPEVPVPVTFAKAGPIQSAFVLDTGASQSVISTALAYQLGLNVTKTTFPVGVAAGGGRADARLAILPEFHAGSFTVSNLPVLVIDLPELDAAGIGGILSPQQAFDGLSAKIDLGNRALTLARGPATPPASPRSTVVPYYLAGFDLAVEASISSGPPALFGLDTGMPSAFSISQGYQPGIPEVGQSVALEGAGGQAAAAELRGGAVRLGQLVLVPQTPGLRSGMSRRGGLGLAGLLGNGLWPNGALTLDNVSHTVALEMP